MAIPTWFCCDTSVCSQVPSAEPANAAWHVLVLITIPVFSARIETHVAPVWLRLAGKRAPINFSCHFSSRIQLHLQLTASDLFTR